MTDSNLLTVVALAHRLRLPAGWLKAEAKAGRIPSLKIGRYMRFNAVAVERRLAARASGWNAGKGMTNAR
jgi:hypothetical protein